MWTPRRILLLVLGMFATSVAYLGYSQVLGSIDGLPNLPDKYLVAEPGTAPPPEPRELPTLTRLKEAFGQNCPEVDRVDVYPFRVQDLQEGVVIAAGRPNLGDTPSRFIRFSPFSMAQFGKPKGPGEEKVPGEITEVTTLHSDVAIVEFDREISSDRDLLTRKGKMIGLELQGVPNATAHSDPRNGRVLITNNQRSADPNNAIVFKTRGPVFYRTQDHPHMAKPDAAHVETAAWVEIVNRENQPKPRRGMALLPSVPIDAFDTLPEKVVAEMALGLHTPPPTIEAEGLKMYLKPNKPDPKAAAKRTTTGFSGVREIVLLDDVTFNLWTDGSGGLIGGGSSPPPTRKAAATEPPLAFASLGGGLTEGVAVSDRLRTKALVRIHTRGLFRYNWDQNTARFEIAKALNPLLPNNVEVTRRSPLGGRDDLSCQLLEIEFNNPNQQQPQAANKPLSTPAAGPNIKMLRATGTSVYLSSASDGMQTFGTLLTHETDAAKGLTTTRLQGTPLIAVRQGNRLTAGVPASQGTAGKMGELLLHTTELPNKPKATVITVNGIGKLDLFDEATKTATLSAAWRDSLVQTKDKLGDKVVDLLVFTGNGQFSDSRSGFDLRGDTLKLWLEGGSSGANGSPDQSKPARLQGIGHVNGQSDDSILKNVDMLNVWFKDGVRAAKPVVQTVPVSNPKPPTTPVTTVATAPKPAAPKPNTPATMPLSAEPVAIIPAKPRPLELSARVVEAWVVRYPEEAKPVAAKTPATPATGGVKYELDKATCEGRVVAKQDPAEPRKNVNGLHIVSGTLAIDHYPAGHRLLVHGTQDKWAFVQFEDTTISGPEVLIDQPNNAVDVPTKGRLHMPSGSDLSGVPLTNRNDLIVEWTERMKFFGERRSAEFVGQVRAVQQPSELPKVLPTKGQSLVNRSYVFCHHMSVGFDRPIYFNQLRDTQPGAKKDAAKVERVQCQPLADDAVTDRNTASGYVVYTDESYDLVAKKYVKAQRISSRFLDVRVADDKTQIEASGPGETRGLQLGNKDSAAPPAGSPPPTTPPNTSEQEMKLTVVRFNGRLSITDQKQIFQKAVFTDNVRAFHVPSEDLNLEVIEHALPIRSFLLKCEDKMTATAYRQANGQEDRRTMEALGNARFRTDDYDGFGHVIRFEEPLFVLEGYGEGQATMQRRQGGLGREKDYKSGNPLTYNRRTGQVSGSESSGGSFTSNGK